MPSERAQEIFAQGFSQLGRKYASSKRKAKAKAKIGTPTGQSLGKPIKPKVGTPTGKSLGKPMKPKVGTPTK